MADAKETIRSKDFISGLFFFSFGAFFFVLGRGYSMGTARAMGPGYFPVLLALLLVLVGIALMARSWFNPPPPPPPPRLPRNGRAFVKMGLIVLSVVVFRALPQSARPASRHHRIDAPEREGPGRGSTGKAR